MASAGALRAIFISCLDLVLFISVMWSVQCLENISGTCQAHHYQKCEGLEKLGYFLNWLFFFSFLRVPHVNIFRFGGRGKEKCRNFPDIFLPNLWVTNQYGSCSSNTPQNFQGKCLRCVCRFLFKDGNVSLGLQFQGKKLLLENTRFSLYIG